MAWLGDADYKPSCKRKSSIGVNASAAAVAVLAGSEKHEKWDIQIIEYRPRLRVEPPAASLVVTEISPDEGDEEDEGGVVDVVCSGKVIVRDITDGETEQDEVGPAGNVEVVGNVTDAGATAASTQPAPILPAPPRAPGAAAPSGRTARATGPAYFKPIEVGSRPGRKKVVRGAANRCLLCRATAYDKCDVEAVAGAGCRRCEQFGLHCIGHDGARKATDPDRAGTGLLHMQLRFRTCGPCARTGRFCDRTKPCISCRANGHSERECTSTRGRGDGYARRNLVPADVAARIGADQPLYFDALGYNGALGLPKDVTRPDVPGPPYPLNLEADPWPTEIINRRLPDGTYTWPQMFANPPGYAPLTLRTLWSVRGPRPAPAPPAPPPASLSVPTPAAAYIPPPPGRSGIAAPPPAAAAPAPARFTPPALSVYNELWVPRPEPPEQEEQGELPLQPRTKEESPYSLAALSRAINSDPSNPKVDKNCDPLGIGPVTLVFQ